ncbi:hypothetical protein CCP3SC1_400010 [Gammaproteobacteria bacterium]
MEGQLRIRIQSQKTSRTLLTRDLPEGVGLTLTQVATYAVRNEKAPLPPGEGLGEGGNLLICQHHVLTPGPSLGGKGEKSTLGSSLSYALSNYFLRRN